MLPYIFAYFGITFIISLIIVISLADFRRMTTSKFLALWLTLPIYVGIEIAKGVKELFKEGL